MALLAVEQADARLGLTNRLFRRLRTEPRIALVKLGRHIRIYSDDLDAYLRASRQEAEPEVTASWR